jgi:hypothetical protein
MAVAAATRAISAYVPRIITPASNFTLLENFADAPNLLLLVAHYADGV